MKTITKIGTSVSNLHDENDHYLSPFLSSQSAHQFEIMQIELSYRTET